MFIVHCSCTTSHLNHSISMVSLISATVHGSPFYAIYSGGAQGHSLEKASCMSTSHNRHVGPPAGAAGYSSSGVPQASKTRAVPSSAAPSRGAADNTSKVIGSYMLGKTIGEGTFGKVKIAVHAPTGERVAVKILEKSRIKDQADVRRVNREIKILKRARHTNVIQLYEVIDTSNAIYLIMESCDGYVEII